MKKVRIAQIGTSQNSHGNQIWNSLRKQSDIFEVVGYALPEDERIKFPDRMKDFQGYREMTVEEILNDPSIEAITVETEEVYLSKYALMVARAGKHLHMEKPGGVHLADFEALLEELRSRGLVFSTGYMYRFNPMIKEAMKRIESGELGKVYAVEAHMDCRHTREVREWLSNFPGGMMFFLGCHLIDLIYRIMGEPDEVMPLNCSTGFDGVSAQDYGMAVFKYPSGVSFAKTCASELGGFRRRQLVICGEKGTIELKPLEVCVDSSQYTVCNENFDLGWHTPWTTTQSALYDRYDDMTRNFAELVRGKENPYSYDYELGLYRLIQRACGNDVK